MCNVVHMDSNIKTTLKLLVLLPKIRVEHTSPLNQNITVCDRIENSDRTGTGPDFVYKIPYRRAPRLACLGRVGRALIYIVCHYSREQRYLAYKTGLGSFWPEPDRITSQKKLTGFDRIGPIDRICTGFLNFNT